MIKITILPLLFLALLFTCSCTDDHPNLTNKIQELQSEIQELKSTATESNPGLIHTVYFYAAEGLTDQRKKEFMEIGLPALAKSTTLQNVFYGPPSGVGREIVDKDYLAAWICHFKTVADHDAYQEDPIHLKFIEDYKDVWGKVLIYDNLLAN